MNVRVEDSPVAYCLILLEHCLRARPMQNHQIYHSQVSATHLTIYVNHIAYDKCGIY